MLKTLEHRVVEHVHGSLGNSNSVICYDTFWRSLPVGVIKINVDVTILTYSTTTAAVVRNDLGQVIKAWAKKIHPSEPCTVEVFAIRWAVELAKLESWLEIIVENNAKLCVDALLHESLDFDWSIYTLRSDTLALVLVSEFVSCNFCWVSGRLI
jgi:hypothetical protein